MLTLRFYNSKKWAYFHPSFINSSLMLSQKAGIIQCILQRTDIIPTRARMESADSRWVLSYFSDDSVLSVSNNYVLCFNCLRDFLAEFVDRPLEFDARVVAHAFSEAAIVSKHDEN